VDLPEGWEGEVHQDGGTQMLDKLLFWPLIIVIFAIGFVLLGLSVALHSWFDVAFAVWGVLMSIWVFSSLGVLFFTELRR